MSARVKAISGVIRHFLAKDLALSLIACSATVGAQPSILSFLSSSASVAIKMLLKLILNPPRDVPDVLNSAGATVCLRRPDALIVSGYGTDVCVLATVLAAVDAPLSQPF